MISGKRFPGVGRPERDVGPALELHGGAAREPSFPFGFLMVSRARFCEEANPAKRTRGPGSRACICSKAGNTKTFDFTRFSDDFFLILSGSGSLQQASLWRMAWKYTDFQGFPAFHPRARRCGGEACGLQYNASETLALVMS